MKMSKKKKKKNKELDMFEVNYSNKSKKKLNKEFKKTIKEIESMRIQLYEADKKSKKKKKKKINKEEAEFYTDMQAIKCRKKMAKKWEKTGFLDHLLELFEESIPIVRSLAKVVASLIVAFLSIEAVKKKISPKTLSKLAKIFDIAVAI